MNNTTATDKFNVGVVTTTIYAENLRLFLDNLIQILRSLCSEVFVITGNFPYRYDDKVHIIEVESGKSRSGRESLVRRAIQTSLAQLKVTLKLIQVSRNFDIVLFHSGEYLNLQPLLCAKLLGKKTVIFHLGGDKVLEARVNATSLWQKILVPLAWKLFLRIGYSLADKIACESENIISFGRLDRYRHKIAVPIGRYLDTKQFKLNSHPSQRRNIVSYIGRLSQVKGVMNFVRSMPLALREQRDIEFSVIGDGELQDEIKAEIEKNGLTDKVTLTQWIAHDELPGYLNRTKLLVLPSSNEGIPGIVQEAMACGTIVVATPVGGIPDLVKDGETGFIISDNTPEGIAKTVIKALSHPNLGEVIKNARALVEKEYTYEAVVKRYRETVSNLLSEG